MSPPTYFTNRPLSAIADDQLLAPLSNEEIAAAKTHWEAKNDESLVDKLNSETSGGLRELIVSLLTGKRTEGEEADEVPLCCRR